MTPTITRAFDQVFTRHAESVAARAPQWVTDPRFGPARNDPDPQSEHVLSIEEAIQRYLATQPPQLYRGGA